MNILLINPIIAKKRPSYIYNLGLAYIAASLLEDGHHVEIFDLESQKDKITDIDIRAQLNRLLDNNRFQAVGIGTLITAFSHVKWLIHQIKVISPETQVWVGNSVGSTIPDIIFNETNADVVIIDEGEITVKDLANNLTNGNLKDILGIAYKKDGNIYLNPPRPVIKNIDTIPVPAYHLFRQDIYINSPFWKGLRTFPISTSRGCPFKCTYCYHPFMDFKIRLHSPDRIVDEMEQVIAKYDVNRFLFADDNSLIDKKRIFELCDLIENKKLKVTWIPSSRVDYADEKLFRRMKECGCDRVGFGLESGSPKILLNIKKNTTVKKAEEAIQICRNVGLSFVGSFMIGNIGETRQTAYETLAFIKKTNLVPGTFFFTTPYPKTELWDYSIQNALITDPLKLIESYGEQGEQILINFTSMSNEELWNLREELIWKWKLSYGIRNPLRMLILFIIKLVKKSMSPEKLGLLRKRFRFLESATQKY